MVTMGGRGNVYVYAKIAAGRGGCVRIYTRIYICVYIIMRSVDFHVDYDFILQCARALVLYALHRRG